MIRFLRDFLKLLLAILPIIALSISALPTAANSENKLSIFSFKCRIVLILKSKDNFIQPLESLWYSNIKILFRRA